MRKTKPTKTIDVIGDLDVPPEEGAGLYIDSKRQKDFYLKPPSYDSVGCDNIDLLVFQNARSNEAVYKQQTEMIEQSRRQEEINKMRVKKLFKEQTDLRQQFIEVNEFLKDCDDKKNQAKKTIEAERRKHEELEKILAKYKEDIAVLTEFRDVLTGVIKDLEPYEKIVQKIVEDSGEFSSIEDCMDRCDAIKLAHSEIEKLHKEKLEAMEAQQAEMIQLTKEASQTILGYMTELAAVERDYEKARSDCHKWEKTLVRTKDYISETQLNKMRMIEGINGMYRLLCQRRGISVDFKNTAIEEQLDFIKDEIEVLQKVVEACQGMNRREKVMQ